MLPRWPKCRPWRRRSPISRSLAYQDSQDLFRTAYPYLQILAQMGFSELQREGLDVDISMSPSARDISKHLGGDVTTSGVPRTVF